MKQVFILAVSILLLGSSASAAEFPRWFDTSWIGYDASNYNTARFTYAATVADLDNDGDPDVATVSTQIPRMTVLVNAGGGVMEQPDIYPLIDSSVEVIAGDFDGDEFRDIVAAVTGNYNSGTMIALYHNNGDATFAEPAYFAAGAGPVGLAAKDFDNDGDLDLAVVNAGFGSDTVSVLLNDGGGVFAAPVTFPAGAYPYQLTAADFDGDGWQDLAVANGQFNAQSSQINILFNDGTGAFEAPLSFTPPGSLVFYPTVATTDIDLDGDEDVLFSHVGLSSIVVLHNVGAREFGQLEVVPLAPNGGGVTTISVGDVTGDGLPDLLGPNLDVGGWTIIPSTGVEAFGPAVRYPSGEAPIDLELADADNDGDLDAFVVSRDSLEVAVHVNQQGSFAPQPRYEVEWLAAWIDAGDIEGDKDTDIVAASSNLDILRNTGSGEFLVEHITVPNSNPGDTKLRDLDNDGDLDLLWTEDAPPYSYGFALNDGTGHFGPAATGSVGTCGTFKVGIDTADLDGDGDLDFAFVENLGCPGGTGPRLFVVENLGGATFQVVNTVPINVSPRSLVPGDFNEDGNADFALVGRPTAVLLGQGDFTFTKTDAADMPGIYIDTADFDGDGHLDLTVAIQRNVAPWIESMAVMLGNGDGTFGPAEVYLGSHSPDLAQISAITTGDVDGDGDPDVLASNYASNDASIWINNGDGTFQPHVRYGINPALLDLVFGDINSDGIGDLLAVGGNLGPLSSGVTIVPGLPVSGDPADLNGDGIVGPADLAILLGSWGSCEGCTADLNGDGVVGPADLAILLGNWG